MDDILGRLWSLANLDTLDGGASSCHTTAELKDERVTEAQTLWRTLETLLTTLKPQELSVGDSAFTKLLSCIRTVLSDPDDWRVHAMEKHNKGVYVYVNRVIVKLGCRGEREREALVRDGVTELLVASMQHQRDSTIASGSVLQVLQTLAFDAKNRQALELAETLPFCLSLMKTHPRDLHVQLFGCKFLQLMVYEEECKEKMTRYGAIYVVLDALRRFPSDAQMGVSALELIYFLSMELESAIPTEALFVPTMEDIIESVVKMMRLHVQLEQVQTNGIAILNGFVPHAQAKRMLCTKSSIWELVLCALTRNEGEAMREAIDFLEALLSDPITFDTVEYSLNAPSIDERTRMGTIQSLDALKMKLESLPGVERKASEVSYITSRLQVLIDPRQPGGGGAGGIEATIQPQSSRRPLLPPEISFASMQCVRREEDDDDEMPVAAGKMHYAATDKEDRPQVGGQNATSVSANLGGYAETRDFAYQEAHATLRKNPSATDLSTTGTAETTSARFLEDLALDSGAGGYFEQFLRDFDNRFETPAPNEAKLVAEPLCESRHSGQHKPLEQSIEMSRSTVSRTSSSPSAPSIPNQQQPTNPSTESSSLSYKAGGMENSSSAHGRSSGCVSGGSSTWRGLYEDCAEEARALKAAYHNLQENYKILSRRAKEQSKLLHLQNSRIRNHMDVQQQALERVRTLEESLQEAHRKHQVERELRMAEVAQSEKISMSLHEAMREIKALNSQNSDASRELMQKEKQRIDYQQKTSEIKHMKQRIELERDTAVIEAQTMKFEKIELCKQLGDCRREGIEALLMREEDVNAPKPRVFSSIGRSSTSSPSKNSRGGMGASFTAKRTSVFDSTSRRNSNSFAVQPIDTSATHSFSAYGGRGSPRKAAFRSLESDVVEDPETIERDEIEMSLKTIYESLDTSLEGNGVHIATVRRFFLESGIVQSPVVAGDVDVILAKVLSQSQENRRKSTVRKDYAFAQTAPAPRFNEAKKFRYFDQETFNEAVTLVGMKRFPRYEIKRVLQTIVAEYLHPIQRRMRASSMLACTSNNSNTSTGSFSSGRASGNRNSFFVGGSGVSFCGSPGANSPSSICIVVMRAILNGLALHVGRGDERQRFPGGGESDEEEFRTRVHASIGGPSLDRTTRKHKREDVVYSMLEMHTILAREQKPLGTICEFYSAIHHQSAAKDELLGLSFELLLNFAMDFEIIPSFMDRVSLKHLYSEVAGFIKSYLALHKKFPHATDMETLKKVAFSMVLARVAIELFSAKVDYETPEKQITGLLQWLDNSAGREKIVRKAMLPLVIKFSRKLYALKAS